MRLSAPPSPRGLHAHTGPHVHTHPDACSSTYRLDPCPWQQGPTAHLAEGAVTQQAERVPLPSQPPPGPGVAMVGQAPYSPPAAPLPLPDPATTLHTIAVHTWTLSTAGGTKVVFNGKCVGCCAHARLPHTPTHPPLALSGPTPHTCALHPTVPSLPLSLPSVRSHGTVQGTLRMCACCVEFSPLPSEHPPLR